MNDFKEWKSPEKGESGSWLRSITGYGSTGKSVFREGGKRKGEKMKKQDRLSPKKGGGVLGGGKVSWRDILGLMRK